LAVLVALALLAFALRAFRLDYRELRGDEAATWVYSIRSFAEMLEIYTIDAHPPLYYPLMHLWFPLAGTTEYSLRFVPLVFGVLLVVTLAVLGRRLVDARTGLVIGLLAAINPYEIYFAQDARSYTLATWLGVMSTAVLWRVLRTQRWREWIAYGLLTVVLAYTHYYFFLIVTFQALFVAWGVWHRRHVPWRYAAVGVGAGLAYLPWLIYAWGFLTGYPGNIERPDLLAALVRPLLAFAGGQYLAPPVMWVNTAVIWPLLALGVTALWHSRHPRDGTGEQRPVWLLALLYLCVPLLVVFLVSRFKSIFSERYLVLASPAFLLLIGAGIVWTLRRHRKWLTGVTAACTVLYLVTGGVALNNYYFDPAYAKSPPWRDVADYIRRKSRPGDGLVYTAALPEVIYYNERAARLPASLIPYDLTVEWKAVVEDLQDAFAAHPRLWLVPIPAADVPLSNDVQPWLDRHSARLDQVFFRVVHIGLYEAPEQFRATMSSQTARFARAGDGVGPPLIQLEGFRFGKDGATPFVTAPGSTLPLTLLWRCTSPVASDYTVFVHVVDADGRLWAQWDNPPVRGTYPTGQWSVDETVFDQYLVPLDAQMPAGDYTVLVGWYDPISGIRLAVVDDAGQEIGDFVRLNQVVRVQ
jgi:4-amino-4-deoxy-L-arabinose transferase-like glycosyltransferase